MKNLIYIIFLILPLNILSQTNDEQFNTFFKSFKNAVKNNNNPEVAELTNFPFKWVWVATENPVSKDSFISNTNVPYIPSHEILSKAKFNESVTLSKDKFEEEGVNFTYSEGFYIIAWGLWNSDENYGSYSEYYFGLIDGEYKYIKCISGD